MFARGLALIMILAMASLLGPSTGQLPTVPLVFWSDYEATARAMVAAGYGELAGGRHFLAFDPAGDGRAVEVVGDLYAAQRVVVLVPGNDTTLRDFDRGLGGVARRAPAVQARAVYQAVQAKAPGSRVAVVAWLGYDPPEGLGIAALREDRASAGAVELQRFLSSLPGQATVTVIGHSYGSTVVGLAARDFGPRVTDIVALGSPGMGVSDVAQMRTRARMWAATAEDDWIRRVPHVRFAGLGHGADPTAGGFGARILPTGGVPNHDSYLVPGSETLEALVSIALGW
jgi:pimeloyl-ACP methyl ester carboxylesterase